MGAPHFLQLKEPIQHPVLRFQIKAFLGQTAQRGGPAAGLEPDEVVVGIPGNLLETVPSFGTGVDMAGALLHHIEEQHTHGSSHFDHIGHALKVEGSSDPQTVVGVLLKSEAQ